MESADSTTQRYLPDTVSSLSLDRNHSRHTDYVGLTCAGTVKTKNITQLHTANCRDGKHDTESDTIIFPEGRGYYIAKGPPSNKPVLLLNLFIDLQISDQHNVSFPFLNVSNVHVFISLFNSVRC